MTICMKCQSLFSEKNKNTLSGYSAELAQQKVRVKEPSKIVEDESNKFLAHLEFFALGHFMLWPLVRHLSIVVYHPSSTVSFSHFRHFLQNHKLD